MAGVTPRWGRADPTTTKSRRHLEHQTLQCACSGSTAEHLTGIVRAKKNAPGVSRRPGAWMRIRTYGSANETRLAERFPHLRHGGGIRALYEQIPPAMESLQRNHPRLARIAAG